MTIKLFMPPYLVKIFGGRKSCLICQLMIDSQKFYPPTFLFYINFQNNEKIRADRQIDGKLINIITDDVYIRIQ